MAKKENVKGNHGSYPFQEKGGSHSKSKTSHRTAGPKDPRRGAPHRIQQPAEAQTNSPSSNMSADMSGYQPMMPKEAKMPGFAAIKRRG